jgi:diguanylate cyclase (GGDEF)-like protein
MQKNLKIIRAVLLSVIVLSIVAGLYFLSLYNNILAHSLIEFTSIFFGVCLFILAISTTYLAKNSFMVLLATVFFTSAVLDFLGIMSYQGLNIFAGFGSNLSSQLWVLARLIQIAGMFGAAFIIEKVLTKKSIIFISIFFPLIFLIIVLSIFVFKVFPVSFLDGQSLTLAKNIIEYFVIGLALCSIIIYTLKRKKIGRRNYLFTILSISFFILSELSIAFYVDSLGVLNLLGHCFKLASFYFIFRFFIETNIRDPYTILFNNLTGTSEQLKFASTHDNVTGFLSGESMFLELKKQFEIAKRFRKKFSIIVIDIDDFYKINDEFGHPAGDRVLSFLADIIRSSLRDVDIKGRYGGDAFVISPLEVGSGNALAIAQKIQDNLNTASLPGDNIFGRFQISAGVSGIRADRTLDEIFIKAEKALLKSKKSGKNRVTMMR